MYKSAFATFLAMVALLVTMAPVANAAPASPAEGTPNDTPNSPAGWYVFHSDDGFHIRTHGPGAEHDFDAVLHTEGKFERVSVVRLEDGDRADVTNGGQDLVIHFHTYGAFDGVDFTVRGANRMRLDLKLDGQPAPTNMIYLGPLGLHPKNNPFHLNF